MNLTLITGTVLTTQVVADLWVFDYFVVVQLTNRQVLFYEKPLILGGVMSPYRMQSRVDGQTNQTQIIANFTLLTWDVSISPDNDTSVFYFAVGRNGLLQRWHFEVD